MHTRFAQRAGGSSALRPHNFPTLARRPYSVLCGPHAALLSTHRLSEGQPGGVRVLTATKYPWVLITRSAGGALAGLARLALLQRLLLGALRLVPPALRCRPPLPSYCGRVL